MIMPGPQASHSRDPPHFRSGNTRTRHNPEPGMLPKVVQTRLKVRAVTSTDTGAAAQNPKISLRCVQRDRDSVPPKQEGVSSRRPPYDRQSRVGVEM